MQVHLLVQTIKLAGRRILAWDRSADPIGNQWNFPQAGDNMPAGARCGELEPGYGFYPGVKASKFEARVEEDE